MSPIKDLCIEAGYQEVYFLSIYYYSLDEN